MLTKAAAVFSLPFYYRPLVTTPYHSQLKRAPFGIMPLGFFSEYFVLYHDSPSSSDIKKITETALQKSHFPFLSYSGSNLKFFALKQVKRITLGSITSVPGY